MSLLFGPVRQIAYVVRDMDRALRYWTEVMRIGPFFRFEAPPGPGTTFRGEPCLAHTGFALAQSGPVQIELIQPLNDAPSPFQEFLASGREGSHHVAFWTTRFDADMAKAKDAKLKIVMFVPVAFQRNDCRLAFLESDRPDGPMIELSEIAGPKGEMFRRIAEAGEKWDGTDPVRSLTALGSLS
jgi:catechol 2,3-dioxygenase-like lactoylglutathione lyase family enzyme